MPPAELIPIISIILAIVVPVGSVFYFRGSFAKTSSEIQERVINALNSEIAALNAKIEEKDREASNKVNMLNDRIGELEKENTRIKQKFGMVMSALRKARLTVDLDGNLVSIADPTIHIAQQRITGVEESK
jgi:prefoldin subunit 5